MTPREVIDSALLYLERGDLKQVADMNFYTALKSAHATAKFSRDLKLKYVVALSTVNSVMYLSMPTEIREVLGIRQYSGYATLPDSSIQPTVEISSSLTFVNGRRSLEVKDYYGYVNSRTFLLSGNQLQLKGADTAAVCIGIESLSWPSFKYSSTILDYESDSWILQEFPQLIIAFLCYYLAKVAKDDKGSANAQADIQIYRQQLLGLYAGATI